MKRIKSHASGPEMHQREEVGRSGSLQSKEVESTDRGLTVDCMPFDPNTAQYEREKWGLGNRIVDEHSYVEFVPPVARPDVFDKNIGHSHESDLDPFGEMSGVAAEEIYIVQKVDYKPDKLLEQTMRGPDQSVAEAKPSEKYLFNKQKGTGAKIIPPSPADPRKRSPRSK